MFFLRLMLVTALALLATADADAQLFRFRQRAQRAPQQIPQQVPQTQSRFNANTYQYTRPPQPQTNVPSTRYVVRPQVANVQPRVTNYYQQPQVARTNVVPVQPTTPIQATPQASGQRVVMLTLRDPRTGQLFQRPYLVNTPQPVAATTSQPAQVATLPLTPINNSDQSTDPALVVEPPADASRSVAQTSFESPDLDPVEPAPAAKKEFSIFEEASKPAAPESNDAPKLESSEPELELDVDEPELTQAVATEPTPVKKEVAEPTPSEPAPQLELELELDESPSVDPGARTRALPFDSAGELDLDIEFAPLNSTN